MSVDKDQLIAALLPDPEEGWRVRPAEPSDLPLLALAARQSRWERALLGGRLRLRGRTRYQARCLFYAELLDFNTLAQCLDAARALLAQRLERHTGRVRARMDVVILCDRALPDALERLEQTRPVSGIRHARVRAAAVELAEGLLTRAPGSKSLALSVRAALQ